MFKHHVDNDDVVSCIFDAFVEYCILLFNAVKVVEITNLIKCNISREKTIFQNKSIF